MSAAATSAIVPAEKVTRLEDDPASNVNIKMGHKRQSRQMETDERVICH